MIRVMVIDDHDVVRKGLIAYLQTDEEIDVIGEASSGYEGATLVIRDKPDVVLMDLKMENGSGIDATADIMKGHQACKVIILTSFYDDEMLFPALEAGAYSYLLKTAKADAIVSAIKKAYEGERVIEPKVASRMMEGYHKKEAERHDSLTDREMEVLFLIGHGMTNQEISEKLYIGIKTVKTHVSNILSKLDLNDRTQAAVYVHQQKLL